MVESSATQPILNAVQQSPLWGYALRKLAMEQLDTLPTYNWSGIYRLEGDTLILDAYVGAHTDHTEIPVGRGVCGTAVAEDANQVIDDVRELSNYLSCSVNTRSEIVVLIRSQASGDRTQEGGFGSAEHVAETTPTVRGLTDPSSQRDNRLSGEHSERGEIVGFGPSSEWSHEERILADQYLVGKISLEEAMDKFFARRNAATHEKAQPESRLVGDHKGEKESAIEPPVPEQRLVADQSVPDSSASGEPAILGQIDIDGHQVGAFDATDEAFLTELGKLLAERWNEQPV